MAWFLDPGLCDRGDPHVNLPACYQLQHMKLCDMWHCWLCWLLPRPMAILRNHLVCIAHGAMWPESTPPHTLCACHIEGREGGFSNKEVSHNLPVSLYTCNLSEEPEAHARGACLLQHSILPRQPAISRPPDNRLLTAFLAWSATHGTRTVLENSSKKVRRCVMVLIIYLQNESSDLETFAASFPFVPILLLVRYIIRPSGSFGPSELDFSRV